jgi:hypothetical protein
MSTTVNTAASLGSGRQLDDELLLDVDEDVGGWEKGLKQNVCPSWKWKTYPFFSGILTGLRIGSPLVTSAHVTGGHPIEPEVATDLKILLLGSGTKLYPEGWVGQAFTFSPEAGLRFGLVQKRGGPCGVLAVVQAFILKNILFQGHQNIGNNTSAALQPSQGQKEKALTSSLTHILFQVRAEKTFWHSCCGQHAEKSPSRCTLTTIYVFPIFIKAAGTEGGGGHNIVIAMPGSKSHFHGLVGQFKSDGLTETFNLRRFESAKLAQDFISAHVHFFMADGNSALISVLCSVMLTRGLSKIRSKAIRDGGLFSSRLFSS